MVDQHLAKLSCWEEEEDVWESHGGHSETYRSGVSTLDVCYAVGNISDMSHQLQEPLHPSGDACDKDAD